MCFCCVVCHRFCNSFTAADVTVLQKACLLAHISFKLLLFANEAVPEIMRHLGTSVNTVHKHVHAKSLLDGIDLSNGIDNHDA